MHLWICVLAEAEGQPPLYPPEFLSSLSCWDLGYTNLDCSGWPVSPGT